MQHLDHTAATLPDPGDVPAPSAALRALDRLVGEWTVSGGVDGVVRYEWMTGRHFLLQHVDFVHGGEQVVGLEVIGHLRPLGGSPSADPASRFYDSVGNTFDYTYELDGDTLTIWAGARGSASRFQGTFSADGSALEGAWVYADGGGYRSAMRRR